jgi:hypothetical protein
MWSTLLCRFVYDPVRNRILSLKNKLIKTRYRRTLDALLRDNGEPKPGAGAALLPSASTSSVSSTALARSSSSSAAADVQQDGEASEGALSVSCAGSCVQIHGSADCSMAGWQMAPYDASSIAYSDSHSGSGSSLSEIVPYSPLGVGFERKEARGSGGGRERFYKISSRLQRAAARSLSAPAFLPPGLVNWNNVRIRQVRKVVRTAAPRVRAVRPKLLGSGEGEGRATPRKAGRAGAGEAKEEAVAGVKVVNARKLCMLPAQLTDLLLLSPSMQGAGAAKGSGTPAGVLNNGKGQGPGLYSLEDAEALARALLHIADRLQACLLDVDPSRQDGHAGGDGGERAGQGDLKSGEDAAAAAMCDEGAGEGGKESRVEVRDGGGAAREDGRSSWLSQAMAWLRGGVGVKEDGEAWEDAEDGSCRAGVKESGAGTHGSRDGGEGEEGAQGDVEMGPEYRDVASAVERGVLRECEQVQGRLSKKALCQVMREGEGEMERERGTETETETERACEGERG